MTKAPVARIIPFSAVDGPGNRTAVFLQGCNQNCLYCHNPETIHLCVDCGRCVSYCQSGALTYEQGKVHYNHSKCVWCDECIRHCGRDSNPRIRPMDAEELLTSITSSLPFVRGITVSGGECTLYPEFLKELAPLVHEKGKTLFLDTNGQVDLTLHLDLVEAVDSFMVDLKAHDGEAFEKLVGNPNEQVVENIRFLIGKGKLFEIRTVLVPNAMDAKATVRLGASLLRNHPEVRYKLIAYRENGVREENRFLRGPSVEEMDSYLQILSEYGIQNVVVI